MALSVLRYIVLEDCKEFKPYVTASQVCDYLIANGYPLYKDKQYCDEKTGEVHPARWLNDLIASQNGKLKRGLQVAIQNKVNNNYIFERLKHLHLIEKLPNKNFYLYTLEDCQRIIAQLLNISESCIRIQLTTQLISNRIIFVKSKKQSLPLLKVKNKSKQRATRNQRIDQFETYLIEQKHMSQAMADVCIEALHDFNSWSAKLYKKG